MYNFTTVVEMPLKHFPMGISNSPDILQDKFN